MLNEKYIDELNEKIYNIKWNDRHKLGSNIFECSEILDPDERKLVTLFFYIISMNFNPENKDSPYNSFIIKDNKRSFNLQDLMSEDYKSIEYFLNIFHSPMVKAILNDVMWLSVKGYKYAKGAIDAYLLLAEEYFSLEKWMQPIKFIKRAQIISMQLGYKNEKYKDVKDYIKSKIISINGEDKLFYSISLLEMVMEYKDIDLSLFDTSIKNILEDAKKGNNKLRLEKIIEINDKYLKNIKANKEKILENKMELAKYYENIATQCKEDKLCMKSVYYYEKALFLYKQLKDYKAENKILHLLPELKLELVNSLHLVSKTQDISEEVSKILKYFKDCSLEESIIQLTILTPIFQKEHLRELVLDEYNKFIGLSLFQTKLIDSAGRTIIEMPSLDINDERTIEPYMFKKANELQQLRVQYLITCIEYIITNYSITESSFNFIVDNNYLIPDARKDSIKLALYRGINGEYIYFLEHIIPHIEFIWRYITELCGGLTMEFKSDGSEEVKSLSKIFNTYELIECYDENILFVFRGLLNEKAGSNLRNELSHGKIDKESVNQLSVTYLFLIILKWLSWYSKDSIKLINANLKSKNYK